MGLMGDDDNPDESSTVNRSGGVDITADNVSVGGDIVGRDKITIYQTAAPPEIKPPPEPDRPPEFPGFVGREAELAYFSERLASTHLAVITGMPGVGKTALAAELARRVHDPDKTFWHEFHQDEGINAILWKLAAFLARHGQADLWNMLQSAQQTGRQPPPAAVLFDYLFQMLRGHGYLLCFDDFHFVDDDSLLEQFVERLRLALSAGELSLIIASQRVPDFVQVDEFEPLTGLSLEDTREFMARHGLVVDQAEMQQAQVFDTTAASGKQELLPAEIVANLHARTEGNALFLTLAADRLKRTKNMARFLIRMFADENIERFLVKEIDSRMNEDERAVMSAVAVLLGYPGTRAAIEAVLDGANVRRVLTDLRERHLLDLREGEAGREYSENALVRAFYYDSLSEREQQAMHRRAGVYYEETEERDVFKAALHFQHAAENERAAQLATADVWALINRGQGRPLIQLLTRFTSQQLNTEQRAEVSIARGRVHSVLGENQLARDSYQEALAELSGLIDSLPVRKLKVRAYGGMAETLEHESPLEALEWLNRGLDELAGADKAEEAALHIRVGVSHIASGDFAAALNSLEWGLDMLSEGPGHLRASALGNLGLVCCAQGDIERGKRYYLQALEISERLHDYWRMVGLWHNLGIEMETAGDWTGAAAEYQKALAQAERLGSTKYQAELELALGILNTKQGDYGTADKHLSNSLAIARQRSFKEHLVAGLSSLADLYIRVAEWEEAELSLKEAEELALKIEAKPQLPEICRSWAQMRLAQGARDEAQEYAARAVNLARELKAEIEEGIGLRIVGKVLCAGSERDAALASFEQSLALLVDRDPYEAARTRAEWGACLVSAGEIERGTALLREARVTFQELGAQRDLAAMEETLRNLNDGK